MLQCIGFASWRDGERERERTRGERRGEVRRRGNHRHAVELRQDRFVYGCMIGWQSVSLPLSHTYTNTQAQTTLSLIEASIYI